jgi:uncharacterized protein (TIGR00369 family)
MHNGSWVPKDSQYRQRVQDSFARQEVMRTLGASLERLEPGTADIGMDWASGLTQQHGFLHAGVVSTALDSACGYAAYSLMPADAAVLTIEFKINLLAPAKGQRFRMEGRVLKPGRTITVCEGRAYALQDQKETLIATMNCTLMVVTGRSDIRG